MPYNRIQAARLLAANEVPVFEASLGEALAALTPAQVRALVKRARTMRDKAQDLLRRQRVATRDRTGHKGGTEGVDNLRTAQKVQALGEALARLEKRLAQLDAAAERAATAKLRLREQRAAAKQRAAKAAARPAARSAPKAAPKAASKAAATTAPRAPARSAKAPAVAPQAGPKGLPPASPGALAKGAVQDRKFTGSQAIQAHVGARGRRQQAKRDGRG